MIDQATYKKEKRRLATARNRFNRAVPNNPYSNELQGEGLAALQAAIVSAVRLFDVAREGLDLFADVGYPDSWALWDVAERDAAAFIHRHRNEYELMQETSNA